MIPIRIKEEWQIVEVQGLGTGLINDSFRVTNKAGESFILQKINSKVFKDPGLIQRNLKAFLSFMDEKWSQIGLLEPKLISELELGEKSTGSLDLWRLMKYFPKLESLTMASNSKQLASLGEKYGLLINLLRELSPDKIYVPLHGFFDSQSRFEQLVKAESKKLQSDLETQTAFQKLTDHYEELDPSRLTDCFDQVCINDCKIGNALFERDLVKAIIDFDTMMVGSPYFEYADLFRSSCWDLDESSNLMPSFKAGYFESVSKGFWNQSLVNSIAFEPGLALEAIKNLIWQQSSRFLSDHFQGDTYYKTEFMGQNLQRAKNQLHLLEKTLEMEPRLLLDLEQYILNKKTKA